MTQRQSSEKLLDALCSEIRGLDVGRLRLAGQIQLAAYVCMDGSQEGFPFLNGCKMIKTTSSIEEII